MVNEGVNSSGAAANVGYESASQFSREFKRIFGNSPAILAAEMRKSWRNCRDRAFPVTDLETNLWRMSDDVLAWLTEVSMLSPSQRHYV